MEPPSSELTGNVVRARIETAVIDLEMREESVDLTSEVIPTSSSESSAEEFQTENRGVFLPPVPPEGYVFWQHKKLKMWRLALPEYQRVFMCNRYIGVQHVKEDTSIRYDTPVRRQ